jgi:hypothetical protein
MIDKLDVRILEGTSLTGEVDLLLMDSSVRKISSRHYKFVTDLRPHSYNLILHYSCRHGDEHNHKLELTDVGEMTLERMAGEIQQVFNVNAYQLPIMRLDLAVDVSGIGVPWFAEHLRVAQKRWMANLGVVEFVEMGKREIQTLYYGKRPNLIRIYNKLEEYHAEYQRISRALVKSGLPIPTFEHCFGMPDSGHILTRVERQMGGGRVPKELATVNDLKKCAAFNPFGQLEFISRGTTEPDPSKYTFMEYSTGKHLQHLVTTQGMQAAIAYITRHTKRNKAWALRKFADFLPVPSAEDLTSERLYALFQTSIAKQFQEDRAA